MDKKTILTISVAVIISFGLGFFGGMEYKAYQIRSIFQEAAEEISSIFTDEVQQEEAEWTIIEKNIGDVVELATIKFKIIRTEEKQIIGSKHRTPEVAKEGAKFVVIDLNITNITGTDFTFFPDSGFRLIDNKERRFTTYGNTIGSIANYLNVRELSPSITENGILVYEIPKDAISYSLIVGKAGTNEAYKVNLK